MWTLQKSGDLSPPLAERSLSPTRVKYILCWPLVRQFNFRLIFLLRALQLSQNALRMETWICLSGLLKMFESLLALSIAKQKKNYKGDIRTFLKYSIECPLSRLHNTNHCQFTTSPRTSGKNL